jgi:hypothetical protein
LNINLKQNFVLFQISKITINRVPILILYMHQLKMREETEETCERRNEGDERGERRMDAGGAAMEVGGG